MRLLASAPQERPSTGILDEDDKEGPTSAAAAAYAALPSKVLVREVERGALLVGAVPMHTRVVLQVCARGM